MKQIKCPNCGAKINSKSYICDYCATELVKEKEQLIKEKNTQPAFVKQYASNMIKQQEKASKVVLIAFLIVWVGVTAFGAIQVAANFSIFEAIPFMLIGTFGVVAMIAGLKSTGKQLNMLNKNELFDDMNEEE